MNKIVVELIDLLYKQLGGYATDCGGDLSEECKDNGCKFLGVCTRQYELSNALHNLKERASQSAELAATTANTGSPKLPPEIVESFYEFCVNGGWNEATYKMLDTIFTFCTKRQLRAMR